MKWQITSRFLREVEFDWIEGSKLIVRSGMTGATGNIYCGLHEFAEMAFMLHLLRPNDLFVDAGANIGSYTVLASSVCGAHSLAVEPDPDTVRALRRNIEVNNIRDRVTIIEAALGSTTGTAQFTIGNDTENRVIDGVKTDTRLVDVRTLDDCLQCANPVFIKIDVEGHEVEVIAGAGAVLRSPALMAIQMETVDGKVKPLLEELGFRQASYNPFNRRLDFNFDYGSERAAQNALFVRNVDYCQERLRTARSRNIIGHWI